MQSRIDPHLLAKHASNCIVPAKIMGHSTKAGRTAGLRAEAKRIFGDLDFTAFKIYTGIVATNHGMERPMVFKNSINQAHQRKATFKAGFGCTIADAIVASSAAFPFFEMVKVTTHNQGEQLVMDGGFVANNPTLFALADASQSLGIPLDRVAVLSVGVGHYNEPKKSFTHRVIFSSWPFKLINKMFNTSSNTIEQLRVVLFPQIQCVRVSEAYPQPEYATDLLESDVSKLKVLNTLGRESFAKHEQTIRNSTVPQEFVISG
jgi:predicted acylesterase/phospholipase RssA